MKTFVHLDEKLVGQTFFEACWLCASFCGKAQLPSITEVMLLTMPPMLLRERWKRHWRVSSVRACFVLLSLVQKLFSEASLSGFEEFALHFNYQPRSG